MASPNVGVQRAGVVQDGVNRVTQSHRADRNDNALEGLDEYMRDLISMDLDDEMAAQGGRVPGSAAAATELDPSALLAREQEIRKAMLTERLAGQTNIDMGGADPMQSELGIIRKIHDKMYLEYINQ